MIKISPQETTKLYAFTRVHYVEYYDLQTELVDHLANGIELMWLEQPNLSFEQALQIEFKKFGIFGFTDLVTERQQKMNKRYNQLIWSILKTYITIPRLFLTTMLTLLMYVVMNMVAYKAYVVLGLLVLPILIMVYKTIVYKIRMKKRKKKAQKLWMFEDVIYSYGQSFALFQIIVFLPQYFLRSEFILKLINSTVGLMFISIVLTIFLIGVYIAVKVIPSKAKEHISKIHPEYNLV
jgi:hypothetical protein